MTALAAAEGYEQIIVEQHDAVALLTLNRPKRMNAWTYQMNQELTRAISACNEDPAIGAIVITGAGKAFCAGADMEDTFKGGDQSELEGSRETVDWISLVRGSKPIIAAVNGASVGVGATMILPCDIIMAGESARFAMGFIKMGLVPELASSHFLVQRMGFGRASEMCLTGQLYAAEAAAQMGLVDHRVPDEELIERALKLATTIAANPSRQLRWVKELLTENGAETDLKLVQKRELALLDQAFKTPEHKEAVTAFMEKRKPNFRGLG
ncbi:MAG: enoyl-CoA hydratase-related protein [Pseudomonadota bacterium]